MRLNFPGLVSLVCLSCSFTAIAADVYDVADVADLYHSAEPERTKTGIRIGYMNVLDERDNAPSDTEVINLYHAQINDWGSAVGWVLMENPFNSVENVQGGKTGPTTKTFLRLDYDLNDVHTNAWLQSFFMGNRITTESNTYLGLSQGFQFGRGHGGVSLGVNYTYGAASIPIGEGMKLDSQFAGMNGGAVTVRYGMPITQRLAGMVYYEAQFGRDKEAQEALCYDSFGSQLMVALEASITKQLTAGVNYHYFDNWGGYKSGTSQIDFTIGYTF